MCSVIYKLFSKTEHICSFLQQCLPIQKIELILCEIYYSNFKFFFSWRIVVYTRLKMDIIILLKHVSSSNVNS